MADQSNVQTPVKETPKLQVPKKKKKWVKRLVILAVIAALIIFALSRCMSGGIQSAAGNYLPWPRCRT